MHTHSSCGISVAQYGDGNTVEENSSICCLTWIC